MDPTAYPNTVYDLANEISRSAQILPLTQVQLLEEVVSASDLGVEVSASSVSLPLRLFASALSFLFVRRCYTTSLDWQLQSVSSLLDSYFDVLEQVLAHEFLQRLLEIDVHLILNIRDQAMLLEKYQCLSFPCSEG